MKNLICEIFGHSFELHYTAEDIWIQCKRCDHQEDVPEERLQEAYDKASVFKGDLSWKK